MRLVILSQEAFGLFAMLPYLIELDQSRLVSKEHINYLMHFVNIKFLPPRPDGQKLENSYIDLIILLAFYKLIDKAIAL